MQVTQEIILNRAFNDLSRWYAETRKPLAMNILSQRYGKQCRKLGIQLTELIYEDKRMLVGMTDKGGRLVVPREAFRMDSMPKFEGDATYDSAVYNWWAAYGVSTPAFP